jgi:hypothetical protein
MRIQTAIITLAIVIMVILSVTVFVTFSFVVRRNSSTGAQHATSPPPFSFTPTTTKNPVANSATLTSGTDPCIARSSDTTFYWHHVYGVPGNEKWWLLCISKLK